MSCMYARRTGFRQKLCKTNVDPRKNDLFDQSENTSYPQTEGGEDKATELRRTCDQFIKRASPNYGSTDIGLRNCFRMVLFVAEKTSCGQSTGFAGRNTIQHNFSSIRCNLLHSNQSIQQHEKIFGRLTRTEDPTSFRQFDDRAASKQAASCIFRQITKRRESLYPIHFQSMGNTASGRSRQIGETCAEWRWLSLPNLCRQAVAQVVDLIASFSPRSLLLGWQSRNCDGASLAHRGALTLQSWGVAPCLVRHPIWSAASLPPPKLRTGIIAE
jgi:hypothetical protein